MIWKLLISRLQQQLTFKNQLFEYIHYCTEINVNLLLNICNFHHKFWLNFLLILSENAPNVDFGEAKFQNFPGEHAPGPPQCTLSSNFIIIIIKMQRSMAKLQKQNLAGSRQRMNISTEEKGTLSDGKKYLQSIIKGLLQLSNTKAVADGPSVYMWSFHA